MVAGQNLSGILCLVCLDPTLSQMFLKLIILTLFLQSQDA